MYIDLRTLRCKFGVLVNQNKSMGNSNYPLVIHEREFTKYFVHKESILIQHDWIFPSIL